MTIECAERLIKLAEHLETGELGHEKFYFGDWHRSYQPTDTPAPNKCGTLGCAIGECPIVFPNSWSFRNHSPLLHGSTGITYSGMEFFCLSYREFSHLFYPSSQETEQFGGKWLMVNAPKEAVAFNIREFVKRKYPDFGVNPAKALIENATPIPLAELVGEPEQAQAEVVHLHASHHGA